MSGETIVSEDSKNGALTGVVIRDKHGLFQKGTAQGPGRTIYPRMSPEESIALRHSGFKAVQKLISMLEAQYPVVVGNGPHARTEMHPHNEIQFRASLALLERLYGKNPQPIEIVNSTDAEPIIDLSRLTTEELQAIRVLKDAQRRLIAEQETKK